MRLWHVFVASHGEQRQAAQAGPLASSDQQRALVEEEQTVCMQVGGLTGMGGGAVLAAARGGWGLDGVHAGGRVVAAGSDGW